MTERFVFNYDSKPGFSQLNPLQFEFENFSLNVKPNLPYQSEELQTNNGDKWKIEVVFGSLSASCSIIYCGPKIKCDVMVDFSIRRFQSTNPFGVSRENTTQTLYYDKPSMKKSVVLCVQDGNISFDSMTSIVVYDKLILVAKIWIAIEGTTENIASKRNRNSLLTDMQTFYSDQSNFDVCFVVESLNKFPERILAHKLILISRSAVFKTMFSTEMNETSSNEIHISDFSADTVRLFVKYLYTDACDEVYLVEGGAEELFRMAHKYEVNGLASLCEAHLSSSLDVNNAADRLLLAATYTLPYLREKCVRFIGSNFKEVSSTADFHAKLDSVGVEIYREIVHAMN